MNEVLRADAFSASDPLGLTRIERAIFDVIASAGGEALSLEEIAQRVFRLPPGYVVGASERARLRSQVCRMRARLQERLDFMAPQVRTVHGVGYALAVAS